MKLLRLALAALVIGAASLAAHAADKAPPITKEARAQGMKEAPDVVQAAGIPCTVTDAAYVGNSGKAKVYEVACKEGLGDIVISAIGGAKPQAFDCLTASAGATKCQLPANADPKAALLTPLIAQAGETCTVKNARAMGANAAGDHFYEAACQEGGGYVVQTSQAAPVKLIPCAAQLGTAAECTLTTKADIVASIAAVGAKSGKPCQVSDAAYLGSDTKSGDNVYEIACGKQPGYVLTTDKAGGFKSAVDCAKAASTGLQCKMTDLTVAESQESGTYTTMAKAGGFNCNVSKYRYIGMVSEPTRSEVVELACTNRLDGVVGIFPTDAKAKAHFIDCVRAGRYGETAACKLTDPAPLYAKYTQALAAKGRTTCKVSGARFLGTSSTGTDYIETACADGAPGYVVEMSPSDSVVSLLSCGQASAAGLACKLPTNQKH